MAANSGKLCTSILAACCNLPVRMYEDRCLLCCAAERIREALHAQISTSAIHSAEDSLQLHHLALLFERVTQARDQCHVGVQVSGSGDSDQVLVRLQTAARQQ
jgi:hypothetical protein